MHLFRALVPKNYCEQIFLGGVGIIREVGHILGAGNFRYVGAIQFIFHVLQLLSIRFQQRNLSYISKPTMKHQQISIRIEIGFPSQFMCHF
jgi:hypothetical protein